MRKLLLNLMVEYFLIKGRSSISHLPHTTIFEKKKKDLDGLLINLITVSFFNRISSKKTKFSMP